MNNQGVEGFIVNELGRIRDNIVHNNLGNNELRQQNMLIFINMIRIIVNNQPNFRNNHPVLAAILRQQIEIYSHRYNIANQLHQYIQHF